MDMLLSVFAYNGLEVRKHHDAGFTTFWADLKCNDGSGRVTFFFKNLEALDIFCNAIEAIAKAQESTEAPTNEEC